MMKTTPVTYVTMDHETMVRHLIAMWTVEGPRAFAALELVAAEGRLALDGEAYLTCALERPGVISMRLHGDERWLTVIARQDGSDVVVEVRSPGMSEDGPAFERESRRFQELVSQVVSALDSVMSPVWARGVGMN